MHLRWDKKLVYLFLHLRNDVLSGKIIKLIRMVHTVPSDKIMCLEKDSRRTAVVTVSVQEWLGLALSLIFETQSVRHIVYCWSFHRPLEASSFPQVTCSIYSFILALRNLHHSAGIMSYVSNRKMLMNTFGSRFLKVLNRLNRQTNVTELSDKCKTNTSAAQSAWLKCALINTGNYDVPNVLFNSQT